MCIEIDCPGCGKQFTINSAQIGTAVQCPHCKAEIDIIDDGFLEGEREVEEGLKRIEDMLSDMSHRFG